MTTPAPENLRSDPPGPSTRGSRLLLLGWSSSEWTELTAGDSAGIEVEVLTDPEDAVDSVLAGDVHLVCIGPALEAAEVRRFLDLLSDDSEEEIPAVVLIAHTEAARRFPDLGQERLLYHLCGDLPAEELIPLVHEALRARSASRPHAGPARRRSNRELTALARRIAATDDPDAAAAELEEGLPEVIGCETATLFLRTPGHNQMRRGGRTSTVVPAVSGIAGYVLKTGRSVRLERADRDPRFDEKVDAPEATGRERLLAAPVVAPGDLPLGAVLALRGGDAPAFDAVDQERIEELGRLAGVRLAGERERGSAPGEPSEPADAASLFRRRALQTHGRSAAAEADVLRLSPAWSRWCYRALLAGLLLLLCFAVLARVHDYERGPAVIAMADQMEVSPRQSGLVTEVAVEVGDVVAAGSTLARMEREAQSAELRRIEREFELHLRNRLRDPNDPTSTQSLIALRGERLIAAAALESRRLTAPVAGVVTDVRIGPGDFVGPDRVAVTLTPQGSSARLVVLLPGSALPQIRPGMSARVELAGFPYAWQEVTLTEVGREAMGPTEARRHLGTGVADSLPIPSSVAVAEADLPSPTFEIDGATLPLHSGMVGVAEVRVRSERLLFALFPGLQRLLS